MSKKNCEDGIIVSRGEGVPLPLLGTRVRLFGRVLEVYRAEAPGYIPLRKPIKTRIVLIER